jgi:hypothetical protein
MNDFLIALLKYVGTPAVVAAALAWLLRTLLSESLRRESDRLRAAIERDSALAIERVRNDAQAQLESLRHQLSRSLEEHKVRFARLQEKRLEPVVTLFSAASNLYSMANIVQRTIANTEEPEFTVFIDQLRTRAQATRKQYHEARLFLPRAVADRLSEQLLSVQRAMLRYDSQLRLQKPEADARAGLREFLSLDYSAAAEQLAKDFRAILGVELALPTDNALQDSAAV